jgi:hypothetical protein
MVPVAADGQCSCGNRSQPGVCTSAFYTLLTTTCSSCFCPPAATYGKSECVPGDDSVKCEVVDCPWEPSYVFFYVVLVAASDACLQEEDGRRMHASGAQRRLFHHGERTIRRFPPADARHLHHDFIYQTFNGTAALPSMQAPIYQLTS